MKEIFNPWKDDLLSFSEYGQTFTNLVQSIETTKVISIEAGFGQGKTFFRQAWAAHLRELGEVVVEIDAQQSDHSGDPLVTFFGALAAAAPLQEKSKVAAFGKKALGLAGVMTRSVLRTALRNGAEELIQLGSEWASGKVEGNEALEDTVKELEEGLSTVAGKMIASQLAIERARATELPQQIMEIRDVLTDGREKNRIVILIDELDRCHPEYSIALLEAMKLVFGIEGFVFCLMVNPDYLESIARHRFGASRNGEEYIEKFVDLRLRLKPSPDKIGVATAQLVMALPLEIPFGDHEAFSLREAAEVAEGFAKEGTLSFRQLKKITDRLELALRCYRDRPIDLPLMVDLAFTEALKTSGSPFPESRARKRTRLTPDQSKRLLEKLDSSMNERSLAQADCVRFVRENCIECMTLPDDRYGLSKPTSGGSYYDWYKVLAGLGPRYVPEHEAMLAHAHLLLAPGSDLPAA